MSSLNITIPHHLTQEEALARIKSLLVRVKQEQKDKISDVKEEWKVVPEVFSSVHLDKASLVLSMLILQTLKSIANCH